MGALLGHVHTRRFMSNISLGRRVRTGLAAIASLGVVTGLTTSQPSIARVPPVVPLTAEAGAPRVPDTLAQRVQACTVCHGREGRATAQGYFPRIAGKPAGYLYNQLVNFRDGRRNNAAMSYLVAHLSDAYLREIAEYFAALDLPYPPPQTAGVAPDVLARGEVLVRYGDAARQIPACSQCHGQTMTGALPAVPGLLGLPRDYLVSQFGAWITGQRRASEPDCMRQIVRRLAPQEVAAVASWLSAQPVPADSRPAADVALPLPCSSGQK